MDASDVLAALLGELDLGESPEDREESLLLLAEAIDSDSKGVKRQILDWVESSRLARGVCPKCVEQLEPVRQRSIEHHPYGLGWAAEARVEILALECPMCGTRFDVETVDDPYW